MPFALPRLQEWPRPYRQLVGTFAITVLLGFLTGVAFLYVSTQLKPEGISAHYRGVQEESLTPGQSFQFEKSVPDMLTTTHNHLLGLSLIFLVVGFLYLHSGNVTRLRMAIAIEPLISLLVTFGGIWIMRFLYEPFAYIILLSGILMVSTFLWMIGVVFVACLGYPRFATDRQ